MKFETFVETPENVFSIDLSLKDCELSSRWHLRMKLSCGERLYPGDSKKLLIQPCLKLAPLLDIFTMRTNEFFFIFKPDYQSLKVE